MNKSAIKQKRKNILLSTVEIREKFESVRGMGKIFIYAGWITALFSPLLFFVWALYLLSRYYTLIYLPLLSNEKNKKLYTARFSPRGTRKQFTTIGYRIQNSDIDNHIAIFKSADTAEQLAKKEKKYLQGDDLTKQCDLFGFDKDVATRHFILIGKTGSGKTVTILSFLNDILKNGGGYIMIDGKADSVMWSTMYAMAKEHSRETSFNTVNLLKPETKPDTNTFNEIQRMHPIKAVEFLTSLIESENSDGNSKHFLNRGKAMLAPIFSAFKLREEFYGEGFSNKSISTAFSVPEIGVLYFLYYCMCKSINEIIQKDPKVKSYVRDGMRIKMADLQEFKEYEAIMEYVGVNPSQKKQVEKTLGINYRFFEESYSNVFKPLREYIASVYEKWLPTLEPAAKAIYRYQKSNDVKFVPWENKPQTANNIRDLIVQFKRNSLKAIEAIRDDDTIDPEVVKKAFSGAQGSSFDNIPDTASQQHSYAVQQWQGLFLTFNTFSHVMGSPFPEISMENIIKNNQILYVLLPALELSSEQTMTLGRMILTSVKESTSKALGGEKMNITTTQRNIYIDRLKPKPLFSIIADEYGSYAVPGGTLATMTQQLRSMNISIMICVQDKVSLKAGGGDEAGQLKALANSSKIALQLADDETVEYLKRIILEEEKAQEDYSTTALGEIVRTGSIKLEKELMLDPKICQSFEKGMGLLVTDGEPIVFQSFYRAEVVANTMIVRKKRIL